MDFSRFDGTPRYAEFRDRVRRFLDAELTPEVRAEIEERNDDHHPGFFKALAAEGWLIPDFDPTDPLATGTTPLDFWEYEILDAELHAATAPWPQISTTRMVLPSIVKFAREPVRSQVIGEVLAGETALTLGYTEPSGGSDVADARTRARRQEDGSWIISGSKVYTTGAHHSKYIFLLTTSNPEVKKGRGLTMFVLPTDLPGVQIDPILTLGERTNTVFFSDVRLSDDYRLGEVDQGWTVLQGPLDAEHSVGGADQGRHGDIGQQYQRRLANGLYQALDSLAASGTLDAADDGVASVVGETALKLYLSGAAREMSARVAGAQNYIDGMDDLVALLGPDSFEQPSDDPAGHLSRLQQRAQVSTIFGGTVEVFRNLIARHLGLPRPAYRP